MGDTNLPLTHSAEIAHHIPGRIRVRLHRQSRHPHILHRLQTTLSAQPGVHHVEVREVAGSVTVHYDSQQHTMTGILGLLEDLDVVVGTVTEVLHIENSVEEDGRGKAALTLTGALDDLDRRLAALTGTAFDLRVLFPLSLMGLGLWQIKERGLMLELLPGWLLVWLGFDALLKLQIQQPAGH